MSEDRSFDLSTAASYVLFIADRSCRKIGVSTSHLHYFMLLCTQWRIQSWSQGGGVSERRKCNWLARVGASNGVTLPN